MLLQSFRFLLGPAGTGKTYTCVAEIRQALEESPEGLPLIFLAPKQATFQLERQILESSKLAGYTRLHIVSFERLAYTIFKMAEKPIPPLLSEQGRVMVLRSLLSRNSAKLSVFQRSSRMAGFAEELSSQIRELERYGISPDRLKELGEQPGSPFRFKDKLHDLQIIYREYRSWLQTQKLEESDHLLILAADLLRESNFKFGGLWLDGFAQFTQSELRFLGVLIPRCQTGTLAFCLQGEGDEKSSYSQWNLLLKSFRQCRDTLAKVAPKAKATVQLLHRVQGQNRFDQSPDLFELEQLWIHPRPSPRSVAPGSLRLVNCSNPEAEVLFCAREIRKAIRSGARFRDMAVLVRDLEPYHHLLSQVFTKFEIPFFLDRRQPVAHHPLAELTRGALRTFASSWETHHLFPALKSGLVPVEPLELDYLENAALQYGWQGKTWEAPIQLPPEADKHLEARLERTRKEAVKPFLRLQKTLGNRFNGLQLAEALNEFWESFKVAEQLQEWNQSVATPVHETVWSQMQQWLEDVKLAFATEELSLSEWLKVLESGLNALTVGVIPPALDHVLLGAVDRSRNPDLQTLFILGFNEGVFPAAPSEQTLLNDRDRTWLGGLGVELGPLISQQLSAENFFGYIAVTRPRERLFITYAGFDSRGVAQNRSRFVARLQHIFPQLKEELFTPDQSLEQREHFSEMAPLFIGNPHLLEGFEGSGKWVETATKMRALQSPLTPEKIEPELAESLYGSTLHTSVSELEKYAACPFKFFISSGLRAQERMLYELDIREQGSFQHEVLSDFHKELAAENKRWRDLSINEAKERVSRLADQQIKQFKGGLLLHSESNQFLGEAFKQSLQNFVAAMIQWLQFNKFDPAYVELPFGPNNELKPWVVKLANGKELSLKGRVDRIDVMPTEDGMAYLVIDYKSGKRRLDKVLVHHGVQQQLPGYLHAFSRLENSAQFFGAKKLIPAGIFFVQLTSANDRQSSRTEALDQTARKNNYPHVGLFKMSFLKSLDREGPETPSGQFAYHITKKNVPRKGSFNCLPDDDFDKLLANTETIMQRIGNDVFNGTIAISPYRKSTEVACNRCLYHGICRTDPWTQNYRILAMPQEEEAE
ncbi:MAG: PD-(D/E)XK nuclease family protein [Verrucomicrobiales bacterium]